MTGALCAPWLRRGFHLACRDPPALRGRRCLAPGKPFQRFPLPRCAPVQPAPGVIPGPAHQLACRESEVRASTQHLRVRRALRSRLDVAFWSLRSAGSHRADLRESGGLTPERNYTLLSRSRRLVSTPAAHPWIVRQFARRANPCGDSAMRKLNANVLVVTRVGFMAIGIMLPGIALGQHTPAASPQQAPAPTPAPAAAAGAQQLSAPQTPQPPNPNIQTPLIPPTHHHKPT